MDITTSELVGMAIVAIAILVMTAQTAFAFGRQVGGNTERLLANKRCSGILESYAGRSRGKSPKSKRKSARKRTAPELVGGVA